MTENKLDKQKKIMLSFNFHLWLDRLQLVIYQRQVTSYCIIINFSFIMVQLVVVINSW